MGTQRVWHDWATFTSQFSAAATSLEALSLSLSLSLSFFGCAMASCVILVPPLGIGFAPSALEAWSPNYWTTREVLCELALLLIILLHKCQLSSWSLTLTSIFFFLIFKFEIWLINNLVLVSGVQQSDSIICICVYVYIFWYMYSVICICVSFLWKQKVKVKVAQSCPTFCNPKDYTVHGILQARILEWVAFLFSIHITFSYMCVYIHTHTYIHVLSHSVMSLQPHGL